MCSCRCHRGICSRPHTHPRLRGTEKCQGTRLCGLRLLLLLSHCPMGPSSCPHIWVSMPSVPRIPWPYLMLKSSCLPTLHPHSPNKRYPLLIDWLEFFSFSSGTLKAQPPSTNATMPLLPSPDALSSTPPSLALVPRGSARRSSIQLCLLG